MLGKLLLTTAVVLAAIHRTSAQVPALCPVWTVWFDEDDPDDGDDSETLVDIRAANPGQVCANPTAMEVRDVVSHWSADRVGQVVTDGNPLFGFECFGFLQVDGRECRDYEVRFCCPADFVPECNPPSGWTHWFDEDNPAVAGDEEEASVIRSRHRRQMCFRPSALQARVKRNGQAASVAGENFESSPEFFRCLEVNQPDGACEDYEVRFCCPNAVSECTEPLHSWTDWFDESDPVEGIEEERHSIIRPKYENEVCLDPIALDARDKDSEVPLSLTGDDYIFSAKTLIARCKNPPPCNDYEVRFCCPDSDFERATEGPTQEPGEETTQVPAEETTQVPALGPTQGPPCSIDIVISIDVSSSMPASEFLRILWFLLDFIQCFDGVDVRIGIITYDCLPKLDIPLGEFPLGDLGLQDAISGLERRGGRTRTGLALHYVKCMSDFREGACPVVLVMTDGNEANGQGTDDYLAQAAMLRESGIDLYAVAVGYPLLINFAALGDISGSLDSVSILNDPCELANRIIDECC